MQAATVVVNRRALRHNLQRLRELAPASKLVAVVKANAYGHGLLETARTLPDADAFGVARLEEALRTRSIISSRRVSGMATVVTGVRPGGSSSITDVSRSAYAVMASVRGIGVAVMIS